MAGAGFFAEFAKSPSVPSGKQEAGRIRNRSLLQRGEARRYLAHPATPQGCATPSMFPVGVNDHGVFEFDHAFSEIAERKKIPRNGPSGRERRNAANLALHRFGRGLIADLEAGFWGFGLNGKGEPDDDAGAGVIRLDFEISIEFAHALFHAG